MGTLSIYSGDGTLSVFNVRGKKVRARSDQMDTELLTLAIMKVGYCHIVIALFSCNIKTHSYVLYLIL